MQLKNRCWIALVNKNDKIYSKMKYEQHQIIIQEISNKTNLVVIIGYINSFINIKNWYYLFIFDSKISRFFLSLYWN